MGRVCGLVLTALPLLAPGLAQAACEDTGWLPELNAHLEESEQAYQELDLERFMRANQEVLGTLECLGVPLAPDDAARVHRAFSFEAFLRRDLGAAQQGFLAARLADPDWMLPATLPPEHELRLVYRALSEETRVTEELPPGDQLTVRLDGTRTSARSTNLPVIFQWEEEDGVVRLTRYLSPGEGTPVYPQLPATEPPPPEESQLPVRRLLGAGVAVGGGVMTAIGTQRLLYYRTCQRNWYAAKDDDLPCSGHTWEDLDGDRSSHTDEEIAHNNERSGWDRFWTEGGEDANGEPTGPFRTYTLVGVALTSAGGLALLAGTTLAVLPDGKLSFLVLPGGGFLSYEVRF